jgi:ATP-dependent Clp protease ATP-binding subunit ClpA
MIICTSNAGAEEIRQYLKSGKPLEKLSSVILDYLQKEHLFRPEFLNRFDAVVCFKPLSQDDILAVAKLMLASLTKTMAEKEIKITFTPGAIKKLANLGYEPTLGARPMARVIQDKVENLLAQKILKNEISRGQSIVIDEKDII